MKLKFILHRIVNRLNKKLLPEEPFFIWKQVENPSRFGYTDDELHIHYDSPPSKPSDNQGWYEYRLKKL